MTGNKTKTKALKNSIIFDACIIDRNSFLFVTHGDKSALDENGISAWDDEGPWAKIISHNTEKDTWGWLAWPNNSFWANKASITGGYINGDKRALIVNDNGHIVSIEYVDGKNKAEDRNTNIKNARRPRLIGDHFYVVGDYRRIAKRVEPNQWEVYTPSPNMNEDTDPDDDGRFYSIDGFNENNIYVSGGRRNFWHFDGSKWTQQELNTDEFICTIYCAEDGLTYAADVEGGLYAGNRHRNWQELISPKTAKKQDIEYIDILAMFQNTLYAVTQDTLWRLKGKKWHKVIFDDPQAPKSYGLLSVKNGLMLIGGKDSVSLWDGKSWRVLIKEIPKADLSNCQRTEEQRKKQEWKKRKAQLKSVYGYEFPDELFEFYDWYRRAQKYYNHTMYNFVQIETKGICDILDDKFNDKVHPALTLVDREAFDAPEFVPVFLIRNADMEFGYWFDTPNSKPVIVSHRGNSEQRSYMYDSDSLLTVVHSIIENQCTSTQWYLKDDPFEVDDHRRIHEEMCHTLSELPAVNIKNKKRKIHCETNDEMGIIRCKKDVTEALDRLAEAKDVWYFGDPDDYDERYDDIDEMFKVSHEEDRDKDRYELMCAGYERLGRTELATIVSTQGKYKGLSFEEIIEKIDEELNPKIPEKKRATNFRNLELEAILQKDVSDLNNWQSYANWLIKKEDPRGEIINLELSIDRNTCEDQEAAEERIDAIYKIYRNDWINVELYDDCQFKYGFIISLSISNSDKTENYFPGEQIPFLESLTVGTNLKQVPDFINQYALLKVLSLRRNYLTELPDNIGRLKYLEDLYLDSNEITRLPPTIGELKNLKTLSLDNNRLSSLPDSFIQLTQLDYLSIESNSFKHLPVFLSKLDSLDRLNIDNNGLSDISELTKHLAQVKILSAKYNLFTDIPEFPAENKLEELDLSDNNIVEINNPLTAFPNLRVLDLSTNYLRTLPVSIAKLRSVENLDLERNQLLILPDIISEMENLQTIALSQNYLLTLPESISRCPKLRWIGADRSGLCWLPESIGDCKNLKGLGVWHNKLRVLPPSVAKLKGVSNSNFEIRDNPFEYPPKPIIDKSKNEIFHYLKTHEFVDSKKLLNEFVITNATIINSRIILFFLFPHNYSSRTSNSTDHKPKLAKYDIKNRQWQYQTFDQTDFYSGFGDMAAAEIDQKIHVVLLNHEGKVFEFDFGDTDNVQAVQIKGVKLARRVSFIGLHFYLLADQQKLVKRINRGQWQIFTPQIDGATLSKSLRPFIALSGFSDNEIYVCAGYLLWHFDGKHFTAIEELASCYPITSVHFADDGVVYVGCYGGGMFKGRFQKGWHSYVIEEFGTYHYEVRYLAFKDKLYIGTELHTYQSDPEYLSLNYVNKDSFDQILKPYNNYVQVKDDILLIAGPHYAKILSKKNWQVIIGK